MNLVASGICNTTFIISLRMKICREENVIKVEIRFFGLRNQSWKKRPPPPRQKNMGLWDFANFPLRNKSWKKEQPPWPPPKIWDLWTAEEKLEKNQPHPTPFKPIVETTLVGYFLVIFMWDV